MSGGKQVAITPEVKATILTRVRSSIESLRKLAAEYGVGRSTIGGWLEREVSCAPTTRSPIRAGASWVADITQLLYKCRTLYFATVVDYLTRVAVGSFV